MENVAFSAPRLAFRVALGLPVWRLLPARGRLALELRDVAAQRVEFVVLAADGHELLRYHDAAAPWWLSLAGLTATALLLEEPEPRQMGQSASSRAVPLPSGQVPVAADARAGDGRASVPRPSDEAPLAADPALGIPAVYEPASSHFAALARFVGARTGLVPTARVEYLEIGPWLVLTADQPLADPAAPAPHTLLICHAETGTVVTRYPLGPVRPGPDAGLFCTFGAILYALGAPGEVIAWVLPGA